MASSFKVPSIISSYLSKMSIHAGESKRVANLTSKKRVSIDCAHLNAGDITTKGSLEIYLSKN